MQGLIVGEREKEEEEGEEAGHSLALRPHTFPRINARFLNIENEFTKVFFFCRVWE